MSALLLSQDAYDVLLPRGDSFRLAIWAGIWDKLHEYGTLAFGAGILTNDDVMREGKTFMHAHNMYLSVLFQGGLVGLLLYLTVLVKCVLMLLSYFEKPEAKLGLAILALGLSAHMLDGHELVDKLGDTWFLVWLPIAISVGFAWQASYRYSLDQRDIVDD